MITLFTVKAYLNSCNNFTIFELFSMIFQTKGFSMKNIVAGTRGSELALVQTRTVCSEIKKKYSDINIEEEIIKTKGDKILDTPLALIGGKGLFTKEIESALINKIVDFAVHSLKDLPVEQPEGLVIGAYLPREVANDIFISNKVKSIKDLPTNATIATGSLRRGLQLKSIKPDINLIDIRGNINTRIAKFNNSNWDGMLLASAAIKRLKLDEDNKYVIPKSEILPAVAQGIVAVECRSDDLELLKVLNSINHYDTEVCANVERSFLLSLGGGCQVPLACYAEIIDGKVNCNGLYMPEDGKYFIRVSRIGKASDAIAIGESMAQEVLARYEELKKAK